MTSPTQQSPALRSNTGIEPVEALSKRKAGRLPFRYENSGLVMAMVDGLLIVAAGMMTAFFFEYFAFGSSNAVASLALDVMVAVLFVLCMQGQRLYRPSSLQRTASQISAASFTLLAVFAALCMLAFAFKISTSFSRSAVVAFLACALAGVVGIRVVVGGLLDTATERHWFSQRRRVAVIGDLDEITSLDVEGDLRRHGYAVLGIFACKTVEEPGRKYREISRLLERLTTCVKHERIDEIFVVFGSNSVRMIEEVSVSLRALPLPVKLLPGRDLRRILGRPLIDVGSCSALQIQKSPLSLTQQFTKRCFDIAASSLGLVLLSPLLLLTAIAIRAETAGPVFFRQSRGGFNGRTFRIWKFRTMNVLDDGPVIRQASRDDSRITRVGAFLRRTSMDELPQLLNVLSGEMSLVGPRPHALSHDDLYQKTISTYALRHHMKPGITGWAQVNGSRGETKHVETMQRRIDLDIWYIDNWSVFLDIKVVVLTVYRAIISKDPAAY